MENCDIINQFIDKDDPDLNKKCLSISTDIRAGKFDIVKLIENLGVLLTDLSPYKRELGIYILTEVILDLDEFLTDKQVLVLTGFYIEKLKDHHQIVPLALKGILQLLDHKCFPSDKIPMLLNTLFENVSCQQQQRSDRYTIYNIFSKLLEKFPNEILQLGMDFVYGLISSIDGERDPSNLIYLFKWLKHFLRKVPLGHLAEEMFDVMACYFPVDFKGSMNESGITRDALSEALSSCLCGSPDFGDLCVALALEKLDSSLEIAKKDSLRLINEGCENFPSIVYIKNAEKLLPELQRHILSNSTSINYEIISLCLETLTLVLRNISQDDSEIKNILKNLTDTVKGNLLPDAKLYESSMNLLIHAAMASTYSAETIVNDIVPIITNTYKISTNTSHKVKMLQYLVKLWKIYYDSHTKTYETLNETPQLLLEAISDTSMDLRITGFHSLTAILPTNDYLSKDVRFILYDNITKLIIQNNDTSLRSAILDCFKNAALYHEDGFREHILNKISIEDAISLDLYLDSLCVLSSIENFQALIVEIMVNHLNDNPMVCIKNMKSLLEPTKACSEKLLHLFLQKNTIEILMNIGMENVLNNSNKELLMSISEMLELLIGPQDMAAQTGIMECYFEKINGYLETYESAVFLLKGLVLRLRRDVLIDYKVLDSCLNLAITNDDELIRDSSIQVFANMLNKKQIDENFDKYIDKTMLQQFCEPCQQGNHWVPAIFWITKVLLMKNYRDGYKWVDQIMKMMEHNEAVTEHLKIIIRDDYESLSSHCHCSKVLLYRQKFFVYVSNKLVDNFTKDKKFYLKAIAYLIEFAPEQAVLLQFKKILRLVLLCLENCEEPHILNILLCKINGILMSENCNIFEENVEDLTSRLLKLATFEKSMIVRIEALKCVINLTATFPVYKLLPFRGTVIKELSVCLDDKKRLVRKEAMEARSLWFLLEGKE